MMLGLKSLSLNCSRLLQLAIMALILFSQNHGLACSGKERRALRAIANRLKQPDATASSKLTVLQFTPPTQDSFVKNMMQVLSKRELCQVRMVVEKKKDAKVLGEELALASSSELIQTVGHSCLFFKASVEGGGEVSKMLKKELLFTRDEGEKV